MNAIPVCTTVKVLLRPATAGDADILLMWRNDPSAYRNYRISEPVTPETHAAWLAAVLEDPNRALYIATADDELVGQVRLDRDGDVVEVTMAIVAKHRGYGFGSRALAQALTECHRRFPCAQAITAEIASDNAASRALFVSFGFQEIVHRGRFIVFELSIGTAPSNG